MTKPTLFCLTLALAGAAFAAPPEITNVQASQREGTKLVDITYDAADADGDLLKVRVEISDDDGKTYSIPAFSFTGDIGEGIEPGTGKHIVWDAGVDWDGEYSDLMRVKIFAIDAKGFPGMEWGNEVPPGGFLLGQDGGAEGSGPSRHVNIPWSYWMGKYEVTRQQYCDFLNAALVAGLVYRDGTTSVRVSATMPPDYGCPIDALLCNIGDDECLRWNVNNFEVVDGLTNYPMIVTWYGAMAFCRFYGYDLPTEAEWEKAARGPDHDDEGEHLCFPWGNEISPSYAAYSGDGTPSIFGQSPVGYYNGNQTPIGPDTINGYGLYDVVGNVTEWTRTQACMTEDYPQEESLVALCNSPYIIRDQIVKGIRFSALYARSSYSRTTMTESLYLNGRYQNFFFGFRPVRRHNATDTKVICSISENFDTWPLGDGPATITTATGKWKIDSDASIEDVGVDGSRGLRVTSRWSPLTFPEFKDQVCFVRVKVRNPSNSSCDLYVTCDKGRGDSVSVPAYTETFKTITLQALTNGKNYQLYIDDYLIIIDDLEIWTVPKEEAAE